MNWNKYLVEFIGTFFLVATIGLTGIPPDHMPNGLAPLPIGLALMVMVYAGGHISGAHYNPAVTLSVFLRGKCPAMDVIPYWVVQIVGALAAAMFVLHLKGISAPTPPPMTNIPAVLLAEFVFTFALCYVVLNVATVDGTAGNSFYGMAIGFTVMAGAFAVGPVSGGVFNPAVAFGITIMGMSALANIWVYLVANFAAAALAAIVFKIVNK